MRIGIDARTLLSEHYTGIARAVFENVREWIELYPQHDFYLFSSRKLEIPLVFPNNWHIIDAPQFLRNGKIWFIAELPYLIRKFNIEVFWGPSFTIPPIANRKVKYVVTVHDLALFKFSGIGEKKNVMRVKGLTENSCRRADCIITVSKSTAHDVEQILGIDHNKIVVSYSGGLPSDYVIEHIDLDQDINKKLKFTEEYFLFISTIEPRKNVYTIIKAFELYKRKTQSDMKLVLAGKKGWNCDEIYSAAEKSEYAADIIMPGFISDKEKAYLLSNAKAFLFPSLYEGFGIPILEAFAYDLPVITSNVSSMPEVAGDAAFYIDDPFDVGKLAEHMIYLLNMTEENRRILSYKMRKRLKLFSWEKNAKEIMTLMSR